MENLLERLSVPLEIKDVDFRVQSINRGGYATILPYKDARVDMNRLDRVCGALWQKDYKSIEGSLFCAIGIEINGKWVWRWDVGKESFSDKEKGKASDAFKRAGFCWGIGRELYNYPSIRVKLHSEEFTLEGGRAKPTYKLKLKDWVWDAEFQDGEVTRLTAKDEKGVLRFDSSNKAKATNANSTASKKAKSNPTKEKPWLNMLDKDKNVTRQWKNLSDAISEGRITRLDEVREHYRISKRLEEEIQNQIELLTPTS